MSIVLNNPMENYMFNIEHDHETSNAPSWRSTTLSLRNNDELGGQLVLGNSNDQYTCVVLDRQMVDERHLISHYYDGSFLMSTSQLNKKFFPTTYLDPYGVNLVIDEWSSFGDLQEVVLQHPMNSKDSDLIWEGGIIHWRDTNWEHDRRHPHVDEWVQMVSKALVSHL